MVEATLMLPWIMFLFIAVFDVGIYYYGIIATQNAARAAVLATTSMLDNETNVTMACRYAMEEMRAVPNVALLDFTTFNCSTAPLVVTATAQTGPDGQACRPCHRYLAIRPVSAAPVPQRRTQHHALRRRVGCSEIDYAS